MVTSIGPDFGCELWAAASLWSCEWALFYTHFSAVFFSLFVVILFFFLLGNCPKDEYIEVLKKNAVECGKGTLQAFSDQRWENMHRTHAAGCDDDGKQGGHKRVSSGGRHKIK